MEIINTLEITKQSDMGDNKQVIDISFSGKFERRNGNE